MQNFFKEAFANKQLRSLNNVMKKLRIILCLALAGVHRDEAEKKSSMYDQQERKLPGYKCSFLVEVELLFSDCAVYFVEGGEQKKKHRMLILSLPAAGVAIKCCSRRKVIPVDHGPNPV